VKSLSNLKFSIPFIKYRWLTYGISIIITLSTFIMYGVKGLNYGIDFRGGIMMEVKTPAPANIADLRKTLGNLELGEIVLQEYGSPQDLLIRADSQGGDSAGQKQAIEKIKNALGSDVEVRRIETVGPKMGEELISNGIQAIIWCLVAMLVYIWLRFEWHFGLCAIIALIHDSIAVFGLYSVFGIEFNTTAIVAILTTIGYSINDTVVIFDRIRENLRKYKKMADADLLNLSINETLSRTILTSGSTLVALFGLYFFGGEVIATYSLPIIVGVTVGTISSICLASPLLLNFNLRAGIEEKAPTPNNMEDAVL
jgi:preprotein translocase subunit SecF